MNIKEKVAELCKGIEYDYREYGSCNEAKIKCEDGRHLYLNPITKKIKWRENKMMQHGDINKSVKAWMAKNGFKQ